MMQMEKRVRCCRVLYWWVLEFHGLCFRRSNPRFKSTNVCLCRGADGCGVQNVADYLWTEQGVDQTGLELELTLRWIVECFFLGLSSLQWNLRVWCANLDLTKAFDRVEYGRTLKSKACQSRIVIVSDPFIIVKLVFAQQGQEFPIQRGIIKQGDVRSLILFNAALESVMRKWKSQLLENLVGRSQGKN